MDYENAKERLENYKKTLLNSIKMYDNTIQKMHEKDSPNETVSFVLQMRKDVEDQITEVNDALLSLEISKKADIIPIFNELAEKMKMFNPYAKNRFVVDFETDDIKDYYVADLSYSVDGLVIKFRNSEEFFVPEYFETHDRFDTVKVYLLSPVGEKKAVIGFSDVRLENCSTDTLDYKSDDILTSYAFFKFKKVTHKTL